MPRFLRSMHFWARPKSGCSGKIDGMGSEAATDRS
jgi:hypothetical protein